MLHIWVQFHKNSSECFRVIQQWPFPYSKFQRGIIPAENVDGVTIFNLCILFAHALYSYQVLPKYLLQFYSNWPHIISILNISKGNNSIENGGGAMVHYLCTSSDQASYLYHVLWKHLKHFQIYWADTISILKFSMGHYSVKNICGEMVLNLCTWSDHALYLYMYQVSWKYLRGFQLLRGQDIKNMVDKAWCP